MITNLDKKLIIGITAPQSTMLLEGQLSYFRRRGYQVFLMAPLAVQTLAVCEKEDAILLPISIRREISPFRDVKSFLQIFKYLLQIKPDIVNFGTPKISLLGLIAAKLMGIEKRIYTCRGFRFEHEKGILKSILVSMEKIAAKSSTKVVCISNSVRELGLQYKLFSLEKSLVIHNGSSNGIDLNLYNKSSLNQAKLDLLRKKHALDGKFIFGFLGRIVERKGFKELIEAFDKLYQQDKNIKLLVIGPPLYDQIDYETIAKAGKHPRIEMIGRIEYEETPYYYSLMDIFVLPAWWEGFGNVLIQAAAVGIPIISTLSTGCKDAVSNGFNGVLIPAKNVDILFETMKKLKNDPNLLKYFSANGKEWAKNFKSEIIWEGLNNIYCEK